MVSAAAPKERRFLFQRRVCVGSGSSILGLAALQVMAKCLLDNEFLKPEHLALAPPPSEWIDAEALSEEEQVFAASLKDVKRRRSRCGTLVR